MGIFGSKTSVDLEVEPTRLTAGGELRVRVTVGDPDKKSRGGDVRLVCRNTYRYETRDSDGDRDTTTSTEERAVAEQPLFGPSGTPAAGTYDFTLTVPADAPPTAADAVEWVVEAEIDRKSGRDARERVTVDVASGPSAYAGQAQGPVEQPSGARMEIEVDRRDAAPGDRLTGTATVTAEDDLSGRALKARVTGVRFDQDGLTSEYKGQDELLEERFELAAGESRTYPLEVVVPADARPTFEADRNRLRWTVDVYVDRKLRGDRVARLPIVVRTTA